MLPESVASTKYLFLHFRIPVTTSDLGALDRPLYSTLLTSRSSTHRQHEVYSSDGEHVKMGIPNAYFTIAGVQYQKLNGSYNNAHAKKYWGRGGMNMGKIHNLIRKVPILIRSRAR